MPFDQFDVMSAEEAFHPYADEHKFGNGPNWRLRLLRTGLDLLHLDADYTLKHGIRREVYAMPIASNSREFLAGIDHELVFDRRSAKDISEFAKVRWVAPRAERDPAYQEFRVKDFGNEA